MHQPIRFMAYSLLLLIVGLQSNTMAAPKSARAKIHSVSKTATRDNEAMQHSYNCCLKSPCAYCKHNSSQISGSPAGQCHCFAGVSAGQTTCLECHGGWEVGQGAVPGKTRKDVRKMKMIKP